MTKKDLDILREEAREVRIKYQNGLISYKQAEEELQEYIKEFNRVSKEKAKKYGLRPQKFHLMKFLKFKG